MKFLLIWSENFVFLLKNYVKSFGKTDKMCHNKVSKLQEEKIYVTRKLVNI